MTNDDPDNDLIRYIRARAGDITKASAYFVEIAELADQIQDIPDSRVKLANELRKNLSLLEAHAEAWQGLLMRIAPDRHGGS